MLLLLGFQSYIRNISNNEVSYKGFNSFEMWAMQMYLFVFAILISLVKKGVELQQEQDLTV